MKYYDQGKPYSQSTSKYEKREAKAVLNKPEARIQEGQREGPVILRTRFEDLIGLLELENQLKGRKTWTRRLQHIGHLRKFFGGMRVRLITSDQIQHYITRRQREGVANANINCELECLHRMMVLGFAFHSAEMWAYSPFL